MKKSVELLNQRKQFNNDRKVWKIEEIEEKMLNLEMELKTLIHQAAEKMEITANTEDLVMKGLQKDLRKILNDATLSNFNRYLFIRDATKEMKENHLELIEKEVRDTIPCFICPKLKFDIEINSSFQYDVFLKLKNWNEGKSEDNSLNHMTGILQLLNNQVVLLKAAEEMGKSTLSK